MEEGILPARRSRAVVGTDHFWCGMQYI
jgi:hypothetical protein